MIGIMCECKCECVKDVRMRRCWTHGKTDGSELRNMLEGMVMNLPVAVREPTKTNASALGLLIT